MRLFIYDDQKTRQDNDAFTDAEPPMPQDAEPPQGVDDAYDTQGRKKIGARRGLGSNSGTGHSAQDFLVRTFKAPAKEWGIPENSDVQIKNIKP